ncbi:MAG: glycosyltransferase, partial [Nitrosopumilus sp.]
MKIGLNLFKLGTFDKNVDGLVQGDELLAMSWQKYLARRSEVDGVILSSGRFLDDVDVIIHFNPLLETSGKAKNILYLQNVFPEPHWKGGTVGIFNANKSKFDGFIFTSKKLMEVCHSEGIVVPFATDPERFYPQHTTEGSYHQIPVSFVGNRLGREKYFYPAIELGLKIWSKSHWSGHFESSWQGFLPLEDMRFVYTNSKINLNIHVPEHNYFGTIVERVFNVLACGGFLISDASWAVQETFEDSVVLTKDKGADLASKIVYYQKNKKERDEKAIEGRRIVLKNHTYEKRIDIVLEYLEYVLHGKAMFNPIDLLSIEWSSMSITKADWGVLNKIIIDRKIKKIVEFGPGVSTLMMDRLGIEVLSFETIPFYIENIKCFVNKTIFVRW